MIRYALRIFRSNLAGWMPTMLVVACVTAMIGVCMSNFIWTGSSEFVQAADMAKLGVYEFRTVSISIYAIMAFLTFFSLTVVGSATVSRIRSTFSLWKLMGASPSQVRGCMWLLVALASMAGAIPGSLLSIPLSYVAVPLFNQMAAIGFAHGLEGFTSPPFRPSILAWLTSLLLGVLTCMLGALLPSIKASHVTAIETLRGTESRHRARGWLHWLSGLMLLLGAIAMAVSSVAFAVQSKRGDTVVNIAVQAGFIAALAVYLLGSQLVSLLLAVSRGILRAVRCTFGVLAARSARARLAFSSNIVTPLATAIGGAGVLMVTLASFSNMLRASGDRGSINAVDTFVIVGVICVVALITSIAVIALSGSDTGREQALLRSAGMSVRGVTIVQVWQSLLLSGCSFIAALIPMMLSYGTFALFSHSIFGRSLAVFPLLPYVFALLATWLCTFLIGWLQLRPALHASPAETLRQD